MARHVFQYESWNPSLPLFAGDPSRLPPLAAVIERPARADQAGLSVLPIQHSSTPVNDTHHDNYYRYTPPSTANPYTITPVAVVASPYPEDVYRADGSKITRNV